MARGPQRRRRKPDRPATRSFRQRGIDVAITETADTVEVTLDGHPIAVTVDGDEYHCQLANQFRAFPSLDDLVDTLLSNEGRTWTLHGHLCDERCTKERHVHGPAHSQREDHAHGGHTHEGDP